MQYSKQSFFLVGIMVDTLSVKSLPSLFPANYCLALYIRTYICMYIFGLKRVPVLHMPSPASQPSLIGVEQSLYQLLAPVVGWLYSMCACWTASALHSFITGLPQQTGLAVDTLPSLTRCNLHNICTYVWISYQQGTQLVAAQFCDTDIRTYALTVVECCTVLTGLCKTLCWRVFLILLLRSILQQWTFIAVSL